MALGIPWPLEVGGRVPVLSEKDLKGSVLAEAEVF